MDARTVALACLGLSGILAVSLAAPALPGAVSFVDGGIDPADLGEDERELLEEYGGTEPDVGEGGSFPAEWLLLGMGALALLALAKVASARPGRVAGVLVVGAVVASILVLGAASGGVAVSAAVPEYFPLVVAALLGGLVLARAFLGLRRVGDEPAASGGSETDEATATEVPSDPARPSTLRAPDVPADNGVFRAWQAVVEAVGPDATATSGEVRTVAIERGFDADAVADLADLFDACRYGRREPTADLEERAETLLARLDVGGDRAESTQLDGEDDRSGPTRTDDGGDRAGPTRTDDGGDRAGSGGDRG